MRPATSWFGCRHITREDNAPYLDRRGVRPQAEIVDGKVHPTDHSFRVWLHHFLSADGDGHHNHPWDWSFSFILRGSYTEERLNIETGKITTRRVRWFNWITRATYHRVTELHGNVWTLFFTGPKVSSWGFWMPGRGHINWKVRLRERGIDV